MTTISSDPRTSASASRPAIIGSPSTRRSRDLIVATYESFAALVRRTDLAPGTVIADEIHRIADDYRGPVVEGLLSRLLASGRIASLCGLSAVVENGKDLAYWLGIDSLRVLPKTDRSFSSFDTGWSRTSIKD